MSKKRAYDESIKEDVEIDISQTNETIIESKQIKHLRVLLLRVIERGLNALPANSAPEYFTKRITRDYSELIHDFTAQTLINLRENIIVRFDCSFDS